MASNEQKSSPSPEVTWVRVIFDTVLVALIGLAVLCYRFPILTGTFYIPRPVYDFNVATEGDEINAHFGIRNLHPWSITLTEVKGSCGCTQPVADRPLPARIAPFESVLIRTTFDTSGRSGDTHQPVRLVTSDNPQGVQLVIQGHVFQKKESKP